MVHKMRRHLDCHPPDESSNCPGDFIEITMISPILGGAHRDGHSGGPHGERRVHPPRGFLRRGSCSFELRCSGFREPYVLIIVV